MSCQSRYSRNGVCISCGRENCGGSVVAVRETYARETYYVCQPQQRASSYLNLPSSVSQNGSRYLAPTPRSKSTGSYEDGGSGCGCSVRSNSTRYLNATPRNQSSSTYSLQDSYGGSSSRYLTAASRPQHNSTSIYESGGSSSRGYSARTPNGSTTMGVSTYENNSMPNLFFLSGRSDNSIARYQ